MKVSCRLNYLLISASANAFTLPPSPVFPMAFDPLSGDDDSVIARFDPYARNPDGRDAWRDDYRRRRTDDNRLLYDINCSRSENRRSDCSHCQTGGKRQYWAITVMMNCRTMLMMNCRTMMDMRLEHRRPMHNRSTHNRRGKYKKACEYAERQK